MSTKTTTPEDNTAIMRRFITEVQEKGDISPIDELIHPNFYDHSREKPGRDGPRAMIQSLHTGLSMIKIEVVHCISAGDVVATHKMLYGTHTGEFFGKAATGQKVQMRVMDYVRIEDGMIREHWATLGPVEVVMQE